MINWTNQRRKVSELNPAPYNPRKWSEEATKKLSESIDRFDIVDPVIINANNTVIGGHFRLKIYKQRSIDEVDVRVPDRLLNEAEEKELNLRLNKNMGDWDIDILADFDKELLDDVGFTSEELDDIFTEEIKKEENNIESYTQKIVLPIYEPKGICPTVGELYNYEKTNILLEEINQSSISEEIKIFLRYAAERHTIFHFRNIAEYYCHADKETKELMEKSGLVIIDYNKAIEYGFIYMVKELENLQKLEEEDD